MNMRTVCGDILRDIPTDCISEYARRNAKISLFYNTSIFSYSLRIATPKMGRGSHLVRTVSIGQSSTLVHSSDHRRRGKWYRREYKMLDSSFNIHVLNVYSVYTYLKN